MPESSPTESLIDDSTLEDLRSMQRPGRPSLLSKVIERYLESSPPLIAAIHAALEADSPESLRQAAHSLKASSAALGAVQMSRLCGELEMLARANTTEGGKEFAAPLAELFDATSALLVTIKQAAHVSR